MKVLFISLFLISLSVYSQAKQKVILDTDIGTDIDDVYALAFLLSSEEVEILGITTTGLSHKERAALIGKILWETGNENIPIAISESAEKSIWDKSQFIWANQFDKVKPITQTSTDFIIEQLYKYPNEIIIIHIGPATTMASVIDKDPEAPKLAKHIYAMAGSFYVGYWDHPVPTIEANVKEDVKAAKKFLASGAKITYAGLDVTNVIWNADKRHKLLERQSPLTNAMSALYSLWFHLNEYPREPVLYDCVPIGMMLWPELFATRNIYIKVVGEGYTVIDESKEPNCKIGLRIKKEEFSKRLMKRYMKQNLGR